MGVLQPPFAPVCLHGVRPRSRFVLGHSFATIKHLLRSLRFWSLPGWFERRPEIVRCQRLEKAGKTLDCLNLWLEAGWCHLQVGGFGLLHRLRRRLAHDKGAGTRGLRVPAPVVLLRTCVWGVLRHQGDEGPSNDALRAGFSTRPSRCGCAGYTCARGRCPSRADGRPGRR